MFSKFFSKDGVEGTTRTDHNGVRWYHVTHAPSGHVFETTVASLALGVAREWAEQSPVVAQITSPLPAAERCASGLAAGAILTMPTEAQARALLRASRHAGIAPRFGHAGTGLRNLRSLACRGWVTLDHPIRPTFGTLTDSGRRALARYEAKHGALSNGT